MLYPRPLSIIDIRATPVFIRWLRECNRTRFHDGRCLIQFWKKEETGFWWLIKRLPHLGRWDPFVTSGNCKPPPVQVRGGPFPHMVLVLRIIDNPFPQRWTLNL